MISCRQARDLRVAMDGLSPVLYNVFHYRIAPDKWYGLDAKSSHFGR
jgi:hypothetical protein